MPLPFSLHFGADTRVARLISALGRFPNAQNPFRHRSESEIAMMLLGQAVEDQYDRLKAVEARTNANVASSAEGIAPGTYTEGTLPQLRPRAQQLLDSIWEATDEHRDRRPGRTVKKGARSGKPRGRLKLTDGGGQSVIDYLAKR